MCSFFYCGTKCIAELFFFLEYHERGKLGMADF